MKKNVLMTAVVVMLVIAGIVLVRNFAMAPADNNQIASQSPSNEANISNTSQQTNQNNQPKTMGLEIKTTQEGSGAAVKAGDTVSVLYTGKLTDGTVFDASAKHGNQPFDFTVGAGMVIKGWDQGLVGMKVGEKRTLTIPGDLAYGANGIPGVIPANATLVFDIELLSIK